MTFNGIAYENLVSFVCLVYVATIFFKGWQLLRMIAWIGLWQLLTPVRVFWEDVIMMNVGFWIVEGCYLYVTKRMEIKVE